LAAPDGKGVAYAKVREADQPLSTRFVMLAET